jgi:hypothetical protein
MYRVALVVATLALASSALAQTPAPAPAAASIDASNCPKPDDHPGRLASDRQRTGWEKEVQAWQECMKKYVGEVQAKADQAVKVANAAVAESNAVVAEYNNTVKTIQAQVDAAK